MAAATVDYIDAIPESLDTLQTAELWHGYLMAESLRVAAGLRNPACYERARKRFYNALYDMTFHPFDRIAVEQMLRDTRA